ncbi:glycosyltransferase family 2 protein [Aquirufa echingensis]|jgi:glycosyltransferase involved in cell wall biosynthesis|uniref:Glycosyltransferase family 2 protein n=1 Tax=Aquirufa echingensis TaxID=3096516 RepID=A0ABW6D0Y0_9BACT
MPKKIKISVLMAVFNTEFHLTKRAIDSVLGQDFQDFELIIIDDGSTKNDRKSLLEYIELHEDKIAYIRHRNRGQAASINRGVINSIGEYITILDSDDEYKPFHLSACLQEMENADLICSTTETVVDSIEDYYVPDKNDLSKPIHLDDAILFGTLFGHQKVFKTIDFEGGFAADSAFYEKAKVLFNVKKVNQKSYIYYRNNPNSSCAVLKRELASNTI